MNKRLRRMRHSDVSVRDQRGSTLLLVTMFMVGLFGFAALTIDVGRVYKEKRHEQFGTDAGAYAAVIMLTNTTPSTAKANAIQEATDVAGANGVSSSELANGSGGGVQVGQWINSTFTADATPYNAVRVPAKRNVGLSFAKVVGFSAMNPAVQSIADLEAAGLVANVIPFGVSQSQLTNNGQGYFGGTMLLNDAAFGSGKQGKLDLGNYKDTGAWAVDMTTNGCNCTVSVGNIPVITGNAQVSQSFNALSDGSIFAMPVSDQTGFTGNNGLATIIGFVLVKLVSSSGNGNGWHATIQFLSQLNGSGGGGSCPPPCSQARAMVQ
jgi:Flp pilus assembly protein TadG